MTSLSKIKLFTTEKLFETHSGTPSVRSGNSDLASSLPGVLAGRGLAGECLSEAGVGLALVVAPGVVAASTAAPGEG